MWSITKVIQQCCLNAFKGVQNDIDVIKILNAKALLRTVRVVDNIQSSEFKVFSQFGEDGIIQYLINSINISCKTFIEFGVENYTEANTRFLMMNNNWKGLVIDGSMENVEFIKKHEMYWKYDLKAVSHFITRENVNNIFLQNGFTDEIGLLSIDIDGNDYWIWESINIINPIIVIVEYNSLFGCEHAVTIPYDEGFDRTKVHFSNLYWGASLEALCYLAQFKGYVFVGSNSAGCNAFFVRKDKATSLKIYTSQEGYVESKFRDSRDESGALNFLSGKDRVNKIKNMDLFDVRNNKTIKVKDIMAG